MKYAEVLETLNRIETECGCELPPLANHTPLSRAVCLLECDDPPQGLDKQFIRHLIGGQVECDDDWIA